MDCVLSAQQRFLWLARCGSWRYNICLRCGPLRKISHTVQFSMTVVGPPKGEKSSRCLPDSPKPDSPKLGLGLGLGFRVRVSVSANGVSAKRVSANRVSAKRDWTVKQVSYQTQNSPRINYSKAYTNFLSNFISNFHIHICSWYFDQKNPIPKSTPINCVECLNEKCWYSIFESSWVTHEYCEHFHYFDTRELQTCTLIYSILRLGLLVPLISRPY